MPNLLRSTLRSIRSIVKGCDRDPCRCGTRRPRTGYPDGDRTSVNYHGMDSRGLSLVSAVGCGVSATLGSDESPLGRLTAALIAYCNVVVLQRPLAPRETVPADRSRFRAFMTCGYCNETSVPDTHGPASRDCEQAVTANSSMG